MGCDERKRPVRRAGGFSQGWTLSPIIHHPLSIIHSRGFTLIELLVVIAIIALLMAVLIPSLSAARKRARAVICRSHLKGWGTTLDLYLEDNEGRFALALEDEEGIQSDISLLRGLRVGNDPNATSRYHGVRTEGIACCPMAGKGRGTSSLTSDALDMTYGEVFVPWEITKPQPIFRMSYGLNRYLFVKQFIGLTASIRQRYSYLDVFNLKSRANIPMLFDATQPSNCLGVPNQPPPPREPTGYTETVCINRHQGAINFLFLDLSVAEVGLKGLWTLRWNLGFNTQGKWTRAGNVQPEDWPEWMRGFKDY